MCCSWLRCSQCKPEASGRHLECSTRLPWDTKGSRWSRPRAPPQPRFDLEGRSHPLSPPPIPAASRLHRPGWDPRSSFAPSPTRTAALGLGLGLGLGL
eukprot:scaffold62095_cov63-Phaeocystis_antarctica.AAC.1